MISRQLGDQLLILQGTAVGAGGIDDSSIVFKINKDGTGYAVLRYFDRGSADGVEPSGTLIEGSDGALCGTTFLGGSSGNGMVFRPARDDLRPPVVVPII